MTAITKREYQILIFFLILYTPFPLCGLEASLSVDLTREWTRAELKAHSFESDIIITSLEEGLTAQIFFQFRVYFQNRGFFSLFGDRLIIEKSFSYNAYKDFFLDQYVINSDDAPPVYFATEDEFLDYFSIIKDNQLIETRRINNEDYYVLAKVSINPVKLEPPLHIISLFSSIGRNSGWIESSIKIPGGNEY
jgi:hypothetical protein